MPTEYVDPQYNFTVIKDYVYNTNTYNSTATTHDPRIMDVYWHIDPATGKPDLATRPALIYVHGGGFNSNNKNGGEATTFCKEAASRGYRAFALNYRLEGDPIKACQDVKAAVRLLRLRANLASIRPDKICVAGDSAGGLAALLSIVSDYETSNGTNELTAYTGISSLSRPTACLSLWAPYNTGFGWAGGVTAFNFNVAPTSTYITSGFLDKVFFMHGELDFAGGVLPQNFYNLTGVIKTIKGTFPTTASSLLLTGAGHSAWFDNQYYVFPPAASGTPPAAGSLPNYGFYNTGAALFWPWLKTQLGL